MEQRYYPRWHRIFSKAKVHYVSETDAGGDGLVKTNMVVGKKTDTLVWRLNEKNEKVVSLAIGQKDLLTKLKERLQSKLEKTDFNGLLTWMQAHAKQRSSSPDDVSSTEGLAGDTK